MAEPDQPYSPELGDYFSALRRRWWLIPLAAAVGLLLGGAYAKLAPKTFTASASVYVTATGASSNQVANSRTSGSVNLDSEAQVAQSAQVAAAAGRLMHSSLSPQALAKQINITVPANSQVLVISCQAGTKAGAALCAQSFARAYLQYSSNTASQEFKNQISALQDRINVLQKQYGKLSTAIASLPVNSPTRGDDESLLGVDKAQLNQYSNQLVTLNAQQANSSGGYIISNAVPPQKPTSPDKLLALAGGLIVGLLAGLIAAFWWARLDRRIRDPRDVARLSLPVLPGLPPRARPRPAVVMAPAKSAEGKAFSRLAYAVAAALGEGSHVVLVSGTSSGHSGSYVAANLAAGLARTHPDGSLVCADLQGSVAPRICGIPGRPGLAELLTGGLTVGEVILPDPGLPRLSVVTPGVSGIAEAAIQQDVAERLLSVLRREARFVVIEAPPLAEAADVYALASLADAAVVVAELGLDLRADLREGTQRLEQLGVPLLGVVPVPALQPAGAQMYAGAGDETAPDEEYADEDLYDEYGEDEYGEDEYGEDEYGEDEYGEDGDGGDGDGEDGGAGAYGEDGEYQTASVGYSGEAAGYSGGAAQHEAGAGGYSSGPWEDPAGEDTVVSDRPPFSAGPLGSGGPAGEQDTSQPTLSSPGRRPAGRIRRR